jgi:hypothetical protein
LRIFAKPGLLGVGLLRLEETTQAVRLAGQKVATGQDPIGDMTLVLGTCSRHESERQHETGRYTDHRRSRVHVRISRLMWIRRHLTGGDYNGLTSDVNGDFVMVWPDCRQDHRQ